METRKLIKFGGSSHIIAIPNEWIKKNSLNKGDLIYIKENGDNELILQHSPKERVEEEKVINIDANKDIKEIKREITAAYTKNFNVIEIYGNNIEKYGPEIKDHINNLVAIEVIEESSNRIIARDFLNIKEVSIENMIRRMDTIIRLMIENIEREKPEIAYSEIKNLDSGINKIRFMLYKVIRTALDDIDIARKFGMTNYDLLDRWMVINYLEEIADELRRFMRFKIRSKLSKKDIKNLDECFHEITDTFIKVMEAYYKRDRSLAHQMTSQKDDQLRKYDEISQETKNKDMVLLLEKIKSLGSLIRCIARGVIM